MRAKVVILGEFYAAILFVEALSFAADRLTLRKKIGMNIEATKLELIKLIAEEQSEQFLEQVRLFFRKSGKQVKLNNKTVQSNIPSDVSNSVTQHENPSNPAPEEELDIHELAKQPMPYFISVEELAKEQGYDGKNLRKVMDNWDYSMFEDQSLEELLSSLTA